MKYNPSLLHPRALVLAGAAAFTLLFAGCAGVRVDAPPENPPAAPREFRAAWVATVANIDWPTKPGLTTEEQQAEMIAILDRARELRLNAIILQVRPAADAMYPSPLEPWSEYLTGEQGKPPSPYYDPLETWINEAHRRGLDLHVWLNPYRARHQSAKSPLASNHLALTSPVSVKTYGDLMWMDPGDETAMRRTLDVVRDIVSRYDVDGVHIDDYFYPYPINAPKKPAPGGAAAPASTGNNGLDSTPAEPQIVEFPDDPSWQRYLAGGGKLARADWRRDNVNKLVEAMYRTIHETKPWVRFGVSPFGLGRPDRRPPGIQGFSQYDKLFADVELWVEKGWMDYLTPQLYWPIKHPPQAFPVLLDYWAKQNTAKRHLWPGLFTSKIDDTAKSWLPAEITDQILLTRGERTAGGHVHFSMIAIMQDRKGIAGALRDSYAHDALIPSTPWLDAKAPAAPRLVREQGGAERHRVSIVAAPGEAPAVFAVWKRHGKQWVFSVVPAAAPSVDVSPDAQLGPVDRLVVSSVDRVGNESERVTLRLANP